MAVHCSRMRGRVTYGSSIVNKKHFFSQVLFGTLYGWSTPPPPPPRSCDTVDTNQRRNGPWEKEQRCIVV
ncbi:unnamed protein product [Gadus morhua 'NCC']